MSLANRGLSRNNVELVHVQSFPPKERGCDHSDKHTNKPTKGAIMTGTLLIPIIVPPYCSSLVGITQLHSPKCCKIHGFIQCHIPRVSVDGRVDKCGTWDGATWLVVEEKTPLNNRSSSVGMMTFPSFPIEK